MCYCVFGLCTTGCVLLRVWSMYYRLCITACLVFSFSKGDVCYLMISLEMTWLQGCVIRYEPISQFPVLLSSSDLRAYVIYCLWDVPSHRDFESWLTSRPTKCHIARLVPLNHQRLPRRCCKNALACSEDTLLSGTGPKAREMITHCGWSLGHGGLVAASQWSLAYPSTAVTMCMYVSSAPLPPLQHKVTQSGQTLGVIIPLLWAEGMDQDHGASQGRELPGGPQASPPGSEAKPLAFSLHSGPSWTWNVPTTRALPTLGTPPKEQNITFSSIFFKQVFNKVYLSHRFYTTPRFWILDELC